MRTWFNVDYSYGMPRNTVSAPSYSCPAAVLPTPSPTAAPTPAPWCHTTGTNYFATSRLYVNGYISSPNGQQALVVQMDGNMVHWNMATFPHIDFATNTAGIFNFNSVFAQMQADGNFVLYRNDIGGGYTPLWHTNSHGNPGSHLAVQDDGNVVVYSPTCQALWSMWHS